jgi:lycopene cyclase CruA
MIPVEIVHPLAEHYPQTVAAFDEMGALDQLERIARLDDVWARMRAAAKGREPAPNTPDNTYQRVASTALCLPEYDLIYAGGGLGLLHAAVMAARYRRKVLLFDRGEVGCAHREWNISREELHALVGTGVFSWDDLSAVIMREYDTGVVRFYAGEGNVPEELWVRHVLDVALDAGALLRLARRKLEAAGGTVRDCRAFQAVRVSADGPVQVEVEVVNSAGEHERYGGRLLLDAMGSISPLALRRFGGQPFAGVCPTVGTVVEGLVPGQAPDQHNPQIGDILLSVTDAQRGQQYMWEGFPGRDDELTVYLFYYDTLRNHAGNGRTLRSEPYEPPNLMQLFEDYFELLPTYKQPGPHFKHLKPVYGYIPARHSVRHQEAPLLRGVLPVGDSAAQQSPLTFCGFGSHVRNLERTTSLLDEALTHTLLEPEQLRLISSFQINVSLNWAFSRFMQPWHAANDVNRVQNLFYTVLNQLGEECTRRFFRDQMVWSDYHKMVLGMLWRHPPIVRTAWQVLGPQGYLQWATDYLVFSRAAAVAALGRKLGKAGLWAVSRVIEQVSRKHGFAIRAQIAEWKVMGWL